MPPGASPESLTEQIAVFCVIAMASSTWGHLPLILGRMYLEGEEMRQEKESYYLQSRGPAALTSKDATLPRPPSEEEHWVITEHLG